MVLGEPDQREITGDADQNLDHAVQLVARYHSNCRDLRSRSWIVGPGHDRASAS